MEAPPDAPFYKQRTPQLYAAKGFSALYCPKEKVGGSWMPCQIPSRLRPSIVAFFWALRNMDIKSARQLVRSAAGHKRFANTK